MDNKIFYDFIEIGTSNFNTIVEECPEDSVGLCVEPMKHYLNQLPEKKNVTKACYAIKGVGEKQKSKIHFIPEETIDRLNLPSWLKGCNTIGMASPHFARHEGVIETEEVDVISVQDLFEKYSVSGAECIKIDTEGFDMDILRGILIYMQSEKEFQKPKWIQFEGNSIINAIHASLIRDFAEFNYDFEYLGYKNNYDSINDYLFVLNE